MRALPRLLGYLRWLRAPLDLRKLEAADVGVVGSAERSGKRFNMQTLQYTENSRSASSRRRSGRSRPQSRGGEDC